MLELRSNWLSWKFWQKKTFHLRALSHCGSRVCCRAPTLY